MATKLGRLSKLSYEIKCRACGAQPGEGCVNIMTNEPRPTVHSTRISDYILTERCPTCQAKAGDPCTQPTNTGRRRVNWHHISRIAEAEQY